MFGILLQFLVEVKSQTINNRYGHSAKLINDKLYILGGATLSNSWHRAAAVAQGGAKNNTLFLYGVIHGVFPNVMFGNTPVIDYNGLIYISSSAPEDFLNDMYILDTINLSWRKGSSINAPFQGADYGAVFLPNKIIIYMGFSLNKVYLYDTINNIWTTKITSGLIPPQVYQVYGFSSVLGLDGQKVIIFGGNLSEDSLYVLDLKNFNWYIPKVTGKIPSSRIFHRTVVIGNYMVVTFANKGQYTQGINNDILLLDISNDNEYVWTTIFKPSLSNTINNAKSNTPSQSNNTAGATIGTVIGSLISGILLTIGSFFLYKWYKNRKDKREQNKAIPTPVREEIRQNVKLSSQHNDQSNIEENNNY
ncbi:hypothetical protein C1645_828343 [Glomus cerebriforme]|uniref:Galactose oxidase n=1 Tax=Glomus cerebriforme TaxID=658196 RepID=A0A397SVY2_9GLOM|nr:hypothetical protein C1645_828343 [Glomus cerebriforme]